MILAHKIALDPTVAQRKYFACAAGCDRFVWNLALEQWTAEYIAGKKPSGNKLKKRFNRTKYRQYPWMKDIHRDAHADPFARLQTAWSKHFKKPKETGRPVFHKKGRKDSFYVANDKLSIGTKKNGGECRVRLPVLGWVRTREPLRYRGRISGARVIREAQRWYISIQVEVEDYKVKRKSDTACGVDLGIKNAVTVVKNTGEIQQFQAPKPLALALRKLRRLQRSISRRAKGGSNRRKLVARVARLHARVSNIRRDFWAKVTTKICSENQAVGIETLNVRGMLRNRCLSRALSDVAIGMFKPLMLYKVERYGARLVEADQWYPSSKTCSACGCVKESLTLAERVFHCEQCGNVKDRDQNAAQNLCAVAAQNKIPTACGKLTPGKRKGFKQPR